MAKEKWEERMEKSFTNPYNFVPFKGRCVRQPLYSYRKGQELLTGYFECRAELLTPFFTPNTSSEAALIPEKSGKSYDFYSYEDLRGKDWKEIRENPGEPVLPAPAIKGVIRSANEAAFNGCVSTADITQELGRRSPFPQKPGVLKHEDSGWRLECCEVRRISNTSKYEEGQSMQSGGYFHIGEPRTTKPRACFCFQGTGVSADVSDEEVNRLKTVLREYSDRVNKKRENNEPEKKT